MRSSLTWAIPLHESRWKMFENVQVMPEIALFCDNCHQLSKKAAKIDFKP